LRPGVVAHRGAENILSGAMQLNFEDTGINTYMFESEEATLNLNGYCFQNVGFGIYQFGGLGPTVRDFYEFRPFISWNNSGDLIPPIAEQRLFSVNRLYNNNGYDLNNMISVDLASDPVYSTLPGSPLNNVVMKGSTTQKYQGLAYSIKKESPAQLACSTGGHILDYFFDPNCFNRFAYLNNSQFISLYEESALNQIQGNSIVLTALPQAQILNNPYVNQYDPCTRLLGNIPATATT
jgi:hypothetical protein